MNKLKNKLALLLTSLTLLFSSCSNNKNNNSSSNHPNINLNDALPDVSVKNEKYDPITYDEKTEEIDTSNGDKDVDSIMDVSKNYAVRVVSKGAYLTSNDVEDNIKINDQYGQNISYDIALSSSNNQEAFLITSKEGYIEGECYTITLKDNSPLFFENKNQNIRRLSFTIKKQDTNNYKIKDNIKKYDYSLVLEVHDNLDINYLILNSKINDALNKDDILLFEDKNNSDNNIYVKFISQEEKDNKYKLNYTDPKPEDIFDTLELHKDEEKINMEKDFKKSDDEEIKKSILNSDFIKEYAAAIAYSYSFGDGWVDFWKSAKVGISFNTDNLQLNLKVTVTFSHSFEDKTKLMAILSFEYNRKVVVSADMKLKTFVGVPYGASINLASAIDDVVSIKLQMVITKPTWDKKVYEKKVEELDWDDAKSNVAYLDKELEDKAEPMGKHVSGSTLLVSLGYIQMNFFEVLSLDLEVFLCFDISGSMAMALGYTWSQHQVCIQYSNSSNDDSSASTSPEISKSSTVEGSLYGKVNLDVYIKLRISLYLTGLKKVARLSADIDFGLYLTILGSGSITYDLINKNFSINAGLSFDFGLFFRVSITISLFDYHAFDYTICNLKTPLVKLGSSDRIINAVEDKKLELNKNEINIDDTSLLTFNVFDATTFKTTVKKYSYNAKRTYSSGLLVPELTQPIFSTISAGDNKLTIENGKIKVNSTENEFTSSIIVKVKALSSMSDYEVRIPVHYLKEGAHFVTFDGENKTAYMKGDKIKLLTPKDKEGYRFKGYSIDGKNIIDTNNPLYMEDKDIDIKAIYVENKIFNIKYYDGFNNLVGEEEVLNETSAKGIDEKERDKNMKGYIFVCYDVDLSCVTKDMEAHAIYMKVE